jgi:hypothetical protein
MSDEVVKETTKGFRDLIDNIPKADPSEISAACENALARIDEFSHMLGTMVFFFWLYMYQ